MPSHARGVSCMCSVRGKRPRQCVQPADRGTGRVCVLAVWEQHRRWWGERRRGEVAAERIGTSSTLPSGRESVLGLVQEVKQDMNGEDDPGFELIAGVLEALSKLDSLL